MKIYFRKLVSVSYKRTLVNTNDELPDYNTILIDYVDANARDNL